MSLSDAKIRSIKPSDKSFKLNDSYGLYLLINPGGSRLWYLKYRFNQKESRIALGAYPRSHFPTSASSATVSVNYWRRITIPHNNT